MIRDARILIPYVVRAFEAVGIPYYIGGSLASSTLSSGRLTKDIDFIIQIEDEQVDPFVVELGTGFYSDAEMIREAMAEAGMFNVIHLESMFKADIYVPGEQPWSQIQMRRRELRRIDPAHSEAEAFMATAEDILVQKLHWYRIGREVSQSQWSDVLDLIVVKRKLLDYTHVEKWASLLGVSDLLKRAISEADAEIKAKTQD